MMKNNLVVFCFSGNPRGICDYMTKLAHEASTENLVLGLLTYTDTVSLPKLLLGFKQKSLVYKEKGIFFCRPAFLIPFQRIKLIDKLNRYLYFVVVFPVLVRYLRLKYFKKRLSGYKYFFFYHPQKIREYFQVMFSYFSSRAVTIFDIVDYPDIHDENDWSYFLKFVKKSDLVTVNSHTLLKKFSPIRKDIKIVPQGFSLTEFKSATKVKKFPHERPIIGFVGALGSRLDFDLLFKLIERNPKYTFIFWGPKQYVQGENIPLLKKFLNRLLSYPNVISGVSNNKREVPNIISQFDICIVPYNIAYPVNKYCFPMKILEYFYMGKPVVSTPIDELRYFPQYVKISSTAKQWEKHIKLLLYYHRSKHHQRQQQILAEQNSWENKFIAINKIFNQTPNVYEKLVHIYNRNYKKSLQLAENR